MNTVRLVVARSQALRELLGAARELAGMDSISEQVLSGFVRARRDRQPSLHLRGLWGAAPPGEEGTVTVPGVLRLGLESALTRGQLRPAVEQWLAWVDLNATYLDHAEAGSFTTSTPAERAAVALPLQSLFIASSFAALLVSEDRMPAILLAIKSGVLSQSVAYYLRAIAEEGPAAAARDCDGIDPEVRAALGACTDESNVRALQRVCEGLTEKYRAGV